MNDELERGESFIAYIKQKPYYLDELAAVVENGMRTGTIASDLQQYSEWLYQEMDDRLQKALFGCSRYCYWPLARLYLVCFSSHVADV